jgi:hypothetical protein
MQFSAVPRMLMSHHPVIHDFGAPVAKLRIGFTAESQILDFTIETTILSL